MHCISLLCWVFLFYIPILNQAQSSSSADQKIALCTQQGVKIVQLGSTAHHTSVDCPCSGQSIAHHYSSNHLVCDLGQYQASLYSQVYNLQLISFIHRPRAPPTIISAV